jgi:hypothetical protein
LAALICEKSFNVFIMLRQNFLFKFFIDIGSGSN